MTKFKELFTETEAKAKMKIMQKELDKLTSGVEKITGPDFIFEAEFYGGFEQDAEFNLKPTPDKKVIDKVSAYLQKNFKGYSVTSKVLSGYVSFDVMRG